MKPSRVFYEASKLGMSYTETETACNSLDVLKVESTQDRIDFLMNNRLSGLYHVDEDETLNSLSNRENFVDLGQNKSIAVCSSGKVDAENKRAVTELKALVNSQRLWKQLEKYIVGRNQCSVYCFGKFNKAEQIRSECTMWST